MRVVQHCWPCPLAQEQSQAAAELSQTAARLDDEKARISEMQVQLESERSKRNELDNLVQDLKSKLESQQSDADTSIQSLNEQASETAKKIEDW